MDIKTIKESLKELNELKGLLHEDKKDIVGSASINSQRHPMLGKRCLIRTHSAGVHVGDVVYINEDTSMECKLENSYRIWKWENGGLSLSAIVNNGMKGGRVNKTGEVYLTNAIEYIPTTKIFEETYVNYVED